MHFLPIILGIIVGFVTTSPVNSLSIKERIFNVASTGPVLSGFKERIFDPTKTRTERITEIKEVLEANDVSARNSIIEDLLLNVIDLLRDLISNGSDDIPVLDPFYLEELNIDGDIVDLPNSHVNLKNVEALGLGTFEIDQLSVSTVNIILQRYRIELDARIPVLDVQASNYDILLHIFGGIVFGNGQLKVRVVNPRAYANVVVGLRLAINGIFLTVRECDLRVNLDAFEAQISGLFDNEVASDFVSSFLSSLVPELLEFFEEDITNTLSSLALDLANEILNDLNLIDLLP